MQEIPKTTYLWSYSVVGTSQLLGEETNESGVINLSRNLNWQDCVVLSSRLLTILQHGGLHDSNLQIKLAGYVFGDSVKDQIEYAISFRDRNVRKIIFSDWQLLTCIKLALLYCGDSPKLVLGPKTGITKIGKWFLAVNDLADDFPFDELIKAGDSKLDSRIVQASLIRKDSLRALQARYFDLLVRLPSRSSLKESPNFVDISKLFNKALNLELETFMSTVYGILTHYFGAEYFGIQEYVVDRDMFFQETLIPEDTRKLVFQILSVSRDEFRKYNTLKYGEELIGRYFDFTFFKKKPLIEIENGSYVPVGIRFLLERITTGIYWDICDSLSGKDKTRFMTFFGEIFQFYVEELFKRIYKESSSLVIRSHYDIAYGKGGGQRSSDIILFYGEAAVFIEVISGGLRMEDTIITGNSDAFWQDMEKVVDASRQLDRVIKDFISGVLVISGWFPQQIKRYFPVVITGTQLPLYDDLYNNLRKTIGDKGYLKLKDIESLEVISVTELEMLEPLLSKGLAFVDFLKRKTSTKIFSNLPVFDFMYSILDERELDKDNPYLEQVRYEFHSHSMRILFGENK